MKKLYVAIISLSAVFLLSGCSSGTSSSSSSLQPDSDYSTERSYVDTGDYDCTDFSTHREAQKFFEASGAGDPNGLDRDSDGSACETLP